MALDEARPARPTPSGHEYDDDACCIHCGFDGAEWHHWKHHTHEGKSQPDARVPLCEAAWRTPRSTT